ncbi:M15 family metallopeptidase [uncultured Polaribacter sp.]|uniref:M15 family metallopeptidase n=1 Tax=uncultured Polaribacter sp. TaxID=174711 RepID=UPI002616CBBE|nr:M15 family metallopeptidase [uncultured Polaribacter sp.]
MKKSILAITCLLFINSFAQKKPNNFSYLSDIDKSIQVDLRYLGTNNFIGKPINGYHSNCVIMTKKTAIALREIQHKIQKDNLSLKVFDAYRPQEAVNHFVAWSKITEDTLQKQEYYPKISKQHLFREGYIATKSGHSRGSTIDVTLVDTKTGKELDMGSNYDFFGEESNTYYKNITSAQKKNRFLLRKIMIDNGFKPYNKEWWHFTLLNEPYKNRYFNFSVE